MPFLFAIDKYSRLLHKVANINLTKRSIILALCCILTAFSTLDGNQSSWSGTPSYYIVNTSSMVNDGSDQTAVRNSFNAWAAVSGSSLQFREVNNNNADITMEFLSNWPAEFGETAAGITLTYRNSNQISSAEIFINEDNFMWTTSTNVPAGYANTQGVITHEVGHAIGLGHSFYREATMYWSGDDLALMNLNEDDERGTRFLYGGLAAGRMCDTCESNDQCSSGICLAFEDGGSACGQNCTGGCPEHAACYELNDGGTTCAPLALTCSDEAQGVSAPGEYCFGAEHCQGSSFCVPTEDSAECLSLGEGNYGEVCQFDAFCESNFCLPLDTNYAICSQECNPTRNRCPQESECISVMQNGIDGVCLPPGDSDIGDPCGTFTSRCASGLSCLTEGSNQVCRALCEPYGNCSNGLLCTPYRGRWTCESPQGPQEGEACDEDNRCGGGLYCYQGNRCVRPCDPTQTNPCQGSYCKELNGLGVCSIGQAELGESCESALECRDFKCLSTASGNQCSQLCEQNPCPSGWRCDEGDPAYCLPSGDTAGTNTAGTNTAGTDLNAGSATGIESNAGTEIVTDNTMGGAMVILVNESDQNTQTESGGCESISSPASARFSSVFICLLVMLGLLRSRIKEKLNLVHFNQQYLTSFMALFNRYLIGTIRTHKASIMKNYIKLITFVGAVLCITAINSSALTLKSMNLVQLTHKADLIVVATVKTQMIESDSSQVTGKSHHNRSWIYTISTLNVQHCIKGKCPDSVQVSQIGGHNGKVELHIPGQDLLQMDQKVLLFLKQKNTQNRYVIVGFNQGIRWVQQDQIVTVPKTKPTQKNKNIKRISVLSKSNLKNSSSDSQQSTQSTQSTHSSSHLQLRSPEKETSLSTFIQSIQNILSNEL
jgi:hypothetical protein